jgi:hypothetical protein
MGMEGCVKQLEKVEYVFDSFFVVEFLEDFNKIVSDYIRMRS